MARDMMAKGPNYVHPEKPSAVGSRNSMNRNNRNEYNESKLIIDEEVDKILNHIHAKLPPEVLEKLDVMGSIKSKLHNYFNQEYQNMLNRYLVTMEDEMTKKVRDLVDKEEFRILNRYTPRELVDILDSIGGAEKFNTGEIEKSVVNMYGHLQGHIQRGITDLETHTNALLREKSDVGAFIRGENSYAVVKCSFNDNYIKPKTVQDVKLSINILDSELISPIYHYQVPVTSILKDVISKHVHELIDKEINILNESLLDAGKEELTDSELIFEKFRVLENYVDDADMDDEDSKRYQFVAKRFMDSIEGLGSEIDPEDYDPLRIRESVKKIVDNENIRNRGFNTAVNSLTSILDTSKMGYQYLENMKNARECLIREYESEDTNKLPDERYTIRLKYYDSEQLNNLREAYDLQLFELESAILKVWDICRAIYKEHRANENLNDWELLSEKLLNDNKKENGFFSPSSSSNDEDDSSEETEDKLWDEIGFIEANPTRVTQANPTYEEKISKLFVYLSKMDDILDGVYKFDYPQKRRVVEDRIKFLRNQFDEFTRLINPYHIQPGLILDVDIVSIKRKKTTMMNMANVLNEFLYSMSKGFADAAFASFSRRRSSVRTDLEQVYESAE